MRFEQQFSVDAPADAVWDLLNDVPRMAGCIPGASEVTRIDDTTYDANVSARIGPIAPTFACRIVVAALDETTRTGTVEVAGKDARLGGGVKARMQMALSGDNPTTVSIASDVDVLGKLGQYGHGMIAKRADAMLADFARCIGNLLAEAPA